MKQNFTVRHGALDGVEAFLSVAQHRSFRRAAAELGVTPSAMSQAVRALEARIGAALFIRTTRSVGLTEAGERFLSRAKPAFEELVAASEVARLGQRPAGLLRLAVPPVASRCPNEPMQIPDPSITSSSACAATKPPAVFLTAFGWHRTPPRAKLVESTSRSDPTARENHR
jgi:Bacterial regulatory helix-turn-helix protein, lysR family